jgi:hypothetical protein
MAPKLRTLVDTTIVDGSGGRPFGALFIRLEPDLLQMGREPCFLPMGVRSRSPFRGASSRLFAESQTVCDVLTVLNIKNQFAMLLRLPATI